jgi:hypothetical protein
MLNGRYSIPVPDHDRWFITYDWDLSFGPINLQLERL